MNCRHCNDPLNHTFLDLGFSPPSNSYLDPNDLLKPEVYYPLNIKVCTSCWLVQTEDYAEATEFFSPDYAYFSSTSTSWLNHAKQYSEMITNSLSLDKSKFVVEIASNDGYLLKNFVASGIPCLGIEPTISTALHAERIGIPVIKEFFGVALANTLIANNQMADLIIGNNVYAHVPNINDFTNGLKLILKAGGTITLEFPHLMKLIEFNQFDTVYHEHFSYLSLTSASKIFKKYGLRIYKVEEIATHGGSLRIYGCHEEDARSNDASIERLLNKESDFGIQTLTLYENFQSKANLVKNNLINFLIDQKNNNKTVVAYGAAAKGNTLLNYAGIKQDLLSVVFDAAPSKQGKFMPGSHIPILPPSELGNYHIDYILILPWNLSSEICDQLSHLKQKGVKFAAAIPEIQILS